MRLLQLVITAAVAAAALAPAAGFAQVVEGRRPG